MKRSFEKNDPSMSQEALKRKAQSPEAQQLLALLQKDGGAALQQAAEAAQRGDYDTVKRLLAPKLQNAQADALLRKLSEK